MGLKLRFSPEDLAGAKVLEPGWYTVEITRVYSQKAKSDGSDGIMVKLKGLEGDAAGVPLSTYFSEKFMAKWINLLNAVGVEVSPDVEYDIENLPGEKLSVFVDNQEYQGRMTNNVKDFRKL